LANVRHVERSRRRGQRKSHCHGGRGDAGLGDASRARLCHRDLFAGQKPRPPRSARRHFQAGECPRRRRCADRAALLTISTAVANEAAYAQAKSALEFAQTELTIVERKFQEKLATNEDVRAKRKALVDAQQALNEQARLGGGAAEETIRAPFDGVISGLMAVAGDKVQANTGFGTISGVTGVVVQLMLDPEDAAKVKPGAEVHMNLPSQGNEQIVGKLSSVGGVVEKDGHLAKAFADVPATAGAGLALGTSFVAHVDLPPREGLVVPRSALLEDETGPYIFIVSNGEAKKENVRPVVETEDMAIIAGFAAPPGTKVIVSGNKDLQDGTPVDAQ
jgi:RND family efflux transporter MFP subunit